MDEEEIELKNILIPYIKSMIYHMCKDQPKDNEVVYI